MKRTACIATFFFIGVMAVLVGQDKGHEGHDHGPSEDHSGHNHGAEDHSGHDHSVDAGNDDHDDAGPVISAQALANMGVEIEKIDSSDFTLFVPVPARVESRPLNLQPVYAPFSGRVEKVQADLGSKSTGGDVLVTIIRDPIPRPSLELTEEIVSPASEEFHAAVAELHYTRKSLEVLSTELTRLSKFQDESDDLSIVPQKDLIDLKYEKAKLEQQRQNIHAQLFFHGLVPKEIEAIENGDEAMRGDLYWLNALKQNRAWPAMAEELYGLLPMKAQHDLWTGAAIAELALSSLVTDELVAWLKETATTVSDFLYIASLLQEGHSLADIRSLHSMGALAPIISVRAPANENGWDVKQLVVKPGQRVEAGDPLLLLEDESEMYLVAEPNGSEIAVLNNASREQHRINATPLTPDTGPDLEGLTVTRMMAAGEAGSRVYLPAANTVIGENSRGTYTYRNWALRQGMDYILKVPTKILEDVIVLPSEAVIQYGADKVVFVREGDAFIRRKVVVRYQDNEVAVIGDGSELLPEEAMITKGAFALHLALIAGTPEAVDPHAGHNH